MIASCLDPPLLERPAVIQRSQMSMHERDPSRNVSLISLLRLTAILKRSEIVRDVDRSGESIVSFEQCWVKIAAEMISNRS